MTAHASPTLVFADGASSGNPGPGGWGALILTPEDQVRELGGASPATTNNKMELTAVIAALEFLKKHTGSIEICTDSMYVIQGSSAWVHQWKRNGWKTKEGSEVLNRDLWEKLDALLLARKPAVTWKHVRGHAGIPGNDRVDEIAVAFSKRDEPSLYHGPLRGYFLTREDLLKVLGNAPNGSMSAKARSKAKAFSYLSVLGRVPMRHQTWGECENRVKGQQGAKFKKALNEKEESDILASWGFKLEDLKKK